MKKINISFVNYSIAVLILMTVLFRAEAEESISTQLQSLKSFDGQPVVLEKNKLTHLIFQEIWSSYEGQGEEARVAALPKVFADNSQQIWIQPEINVTVAQLTEFQGYYPQVRPLVLDRGFSLMRSLKRWDLPLHVILKDGKKVFSGNGDELTAISAEHFNNQQTINNWSQTANALVAKVANNTDKKIFSINDAISPRYHKPKQGEQAPVFSAKTMKGEVVSLMGLSYNKPLSLIFIDSLCPMPHFPGCEAKLASINELVASDTSREWLGVVSSYYVSEEIVQQFRAKFKLTLPLIFDIDNQIYQLYGVHASPYQIDISRNGNIRSRGTEIH